jgi:hypothetical protein
MIDVIKLLNPYDRCTALECDGLTRVLHTVLSMADVKHTCFIGRVTLGQEDVAPHFWIQLMDGRLVDYRLRMWLSGDNLPHGVFSAADYPHVIYAGADIELTPLPRVLLETLTSLHTR